MTDTTQRSVAWLVESEPGGLWWDGRFISRGIDPRFFTRDPNEAVRFARREDAEKVAASSSAMKATEHVWMAAAQPQQASAMERMRARFDAQYGDMADVMRAALAWRARWADYQRHYNAEMENPVTEADVDTAECRMLEAVQAYARDKAAQPQQAEPAAWQERQEVRPGVFGEWYECRHGWSHTRSREVVSAGIRYQFRPLYA